MPQENFDMEELLDNSVNVDKVMENGLKSADTMGNQINLRVRSPTNTAIEELAKHYGVTPNQITRALAVKGHEVFRNTNEEKIENFYQNKTLVKSDDIGQLFKNHDPKEYLSDTEVVNTILFQDTWNYAENVNRRLEWGSTQYLIRLFVLLGLKSSNTFSNISEKVKEQTGMELMSDAKESLKEDENMVQDYVDMANELVNMIDIRREIFDGEFISIQNEEGVEKVREQFDQWNPEVNN